MALLNTAKVTSFEDGTGLITNGTSLRVQFNYTFTEGSEEGLNYTPEEIFFPDDTWLQPSTPYYLIFL
jgi:hypothetical protein